MQSILLDKYENALDDFDEGHDMEKITKTTFNNLKGLEKICNDLRKEIETVRVTEYVTIEEEERFLSLVERHHEILIKSLDFKKNLESLEQSYL